MAKWFVLLLIIVPAAEVGVLILSGNTIGIWPTIALIIATGLLGAWLAKREGLQVFRTLQMQTQRGEMPGDIVLDGVCILVGGTLLLTPGFITDALGFSLLIPWSRRGMKAVLKKWFKKMVDNGNIKVMGRRW
ncbi:UPF0716 protein FxsA [Marinococcus luteus]|uniref:UPF0716 protein FxsA n=1 Tax=Marinococcus luteus TaxID=1122204 RepID=A0A1H2VN21_9BACI|nr:FxsA family protein [Marinococcus luteus]SDW69680.1 UPF0716 protein FxsA [Marinococcus luteus]